MKELLISLVEFWPGWLTLAAASWLYSSSNAYLKEGKDEDYLGRWR